MTQSAMVAYLEDGPRAGQVVGIEPGPEGAPPDQVVVSDPLGMDEAPENAVEVGVSLRNATTYHLHEPAAASNTFIYRTGDPVG